MLFLLCSCSFRAGARLSFRYWQFPFLLSEHLHSSFRWDFTINTLTMFGFVLAIGIVVDDAIIVVEATQHYIDREKITSEGSNDQSDAGYFRARCRHRINSRRSFHSGRIYSWNRRTPVSTVRHYDSNFGSHLGVCRLVVDTGSLHHSPETVTRRCKCKGPQ